MSFLFDAGGLSDGGIEMIRKIVEIKEEACIGCGRCAEACHEGAIVMVDGVAKLIRDDYCDGLGDCLPACPADAIRIIEREAAAYDEEAVQAHILSRKQAKEEASFCGCAGSQERTILHDSDKADAEVCCGAPVKSQLTMWPVQIQLAPVNAGFFAGADLLVAADCTAYAYGNFHNEFMKEKVTLVGCPKLDPVDYAEKLTKIFIENDIQSITLTRMEVPCCGGMEYAVKEALFASGRQIPLRVVTISIDGEILDAR